MSEPGVKRPAVVFNPVKFTERDALVEQLTELCRTRDLVEPLWFETTAEDPGHGPTRAALEQGADLVLVCGGDGTVAACAATLAGTGVAMALVPAGTGNLLARNLDLPTKVSDAVDVAFGTRRLAIDMVRTNDDGMFVVMAGLGIDAAMMDETNERTKDRIGWPAYLGGMARAVRSSSSVSLTVGVDGGEPIRYDAVCVLIGNVGRLQAGLAVLPEASPTDGVLDVAIFAPAGWRDWPRIVSRLVRGRVAAGGPSTIVRGSRIEVRCDQSLPVEFDGEPAGDARSLTAEVWAGALTVCVPS